LGKTLVSSLACITNHSDCGSVFAFKLLGINFEANVSWSLHINTITAKANKRLYFLKQLKRAGVSTHQLLHFYVTVIRPVLEYCTPICHYAVTRTQTEQTESIQKRAIRIIFPFTREITYPYALFAANLNSAFQTLRHFKVILSRHLPAFTTSSHLHVTLLFYPSSELSLLSHAYSPVLKALILHYMRIK